MLSLASVAGAAVITASAQVMTFNQTVGTMIDPYNVNPYTITVPSTTFNGLKVADVNVLLNISGAPQMYNADFIAYLVHSDKLVYLINKVGWTSSGGTGYGGSGINVKLDDAQGAARDIHLYGEVIDPGGPVTGNWASDGRVVATNPRSTNPNPLSAFNGTDPGGNWTLYVGDVNGLAGSTVYSSAMMNSWGVEITAVPEPSEYAMVFGLALIGFAAYRRYTVKTA